jgi:VanZ family protein
MRPKLDPVSRVLVVAAVLTVLLAAAVAYIMLMPPSPQMRRLGHLDKLFHFLAFFVLVLPLSMALTAQRFLGVLVLGAIAYGIAIEITQPVFGRSAEIGDVVANSLGAISGSVLGATLRLLWTRRRASQSERA